jgi:ElaB/YqjD/DUF883 family membrane-anchored ribosome-binding protein
MFQYRSSDFATRFDAVAKHLGAVEKELENIGRIAGRNGSAAASAAGEQIGDALSSIVNDMVERFRFGSRAAGDQAARFSKNALRLGSNYGNDALQRMSAKVEEQPLITVGVAVGVGILVGLALLGSVNRR